MIHIRVNAAYLLDRAIDEESGQKADLELLRFSAQDDIDSLIAFEDDLYCDCYLLPIRGLPASILLEETTIDGNKCFTAIGMGGHYRLQDIPFITFEENRKQWAVALIDSDETREQAQNPTTLGRLLKEWWVISLLYGAGSAFITLIFYLLPLTELGLLISVLITVWMVVTFFVYSRDPAKFHRRWIGFLIPIGPLHAAGISFNFRASNITNWKIEWNSEPSSSFLVMWGLVIIVLLIVDLFNRKK